MKPAFLFLGAFCAFLGVGFGAFGAHALKVTLSPESLAVYQTGVTYQMWHSLGLLGIGLLQHQTPDSKLVPWAVWLMLAAISRVVALCSSTAAAIELLVAFTS